MTETQKLIEKLLTDLKQRGILNLNEDLDLDETITDLFS